MKILNIFAICGILTNVNAQGWSESFNVDATLTSANILTSDMTWLWWGWGGVQVTDGAMVLTMPDPGTDPFDLNTCWMQIDQSTDSNAVITPDSVTIHMKVKFITTGTISEGDQLHVAVALDPGSMINNEAYTVAFSAVGSIGDWYFWNSGPTFSPSSAIEYGSWFWGKIVVSNDTVSVWAFADGDEPSDTANHIFTPDGVDLSTAVATFFIIGLTDDDSSAVLIDEIWYNETPPSMKITDDISIPSGYELSQNYPNPFNPATHIRFNIPKFGLVNITIYDLLGRQVKTLINQTQAAGYTSVIWDATNDLGQPVSAGVYLYQIQSGEFTQTRKLVLLK